MLNCRQKINFILQVFLEILERYCKTVILVTLGIPGYAHSKWFYHLVENLHVYLQVESQPHHQYFSRIITKICKHLILGANDQLVKNFNFYLHGRKTKNSWKNPKIWWITSYIHKSKNQNFSRYRIGGEVSIKILVFNLDYFQKKLMTNFSENAKNPILGAFWALFP